jgi:hypothetical protein
VVHADKRSLKKKMRNAFKTLTPSQSGAMEVILFLILLHHLTTLPL